MKAKFTQNIAVTTSLIGWLFGAVGCSTAEVAPHPAPSVEPPPYVKVPHPEGYDLGDVRAIFLNQTAPKPEELKDCEADLVKLKSFTQSESEISNGARELIKTDPVKYHWCFYGKILKLEEQLKTLTYIDEKQKAVLESYSFLTPVSRAYLVEYKDSRYLRWAVKHYRNLSEWVFYRKLELTPQATVDLVEASNPFALLRAPEAPKPVLEKYGLVAAPVPTAPVATSPAPAPAAPEVAAAAIPSATPVVTPSATPSSAPEATSTASNTPAAAEAPVATPAPAAAVTEAPAVAATPATEAAPVAAAPTDTATAATSTAAAIPAVVTPEPEQARIPASEPAPKN